MILVINGGSSSIKFKLFNTDFSVIASGICERIFVGGNFELEYLNKETNEMVEFKNEIEFPDHNVAIEYLFDQLLEKKIINSLDEISGIGHRVVQGASTLSKPEIVDERVEKLIEENIDLAPLHNKPQLAIIRATKAKAPSIMNVACFDSGFHTTIPEVNSTYAIPKEWREELRIKRYGAHGISYEYITEKMKQILGKDEVNLIVCHLGGGASVCAIRKNKSYNTSMGLTPLEGLVMGTRSGDVDPSIFKYVSKQKGLDAVEIDRILNFESGVKALCGRTDFRDITPKYDVDEEAKLAVDLFTKRVADYVVRYTNDLENKVDALVFCGGITENDGVIRHKIINRLHLGDYYIDEEKNKEKTKDYMEITKEAFPDFKRVFVVKTNEEIQIAKSVASLKTNN